MNKRTLQSLVLGISIGMAVGLGVYTFGYAKGASYLMNNPASCANCHIMKEQYDGWLMSSHRAVATCNDCHTPANIPRGLDSQYAPRRFNRSGAEFRAAQVGQDFAAPAQLPLRPAQVVYHSRPGIRVIVRAIDAHDIHPCREQVSR